MIRKILRQIYNILNPPPVSKEKVDPVTLFLMSECGFELEEKKSEKDISDRVPKKSQGNGDSK